MLDGVEAEAKGARELGLGHVKPRANMLHVDGLWNVNLKSGFLASQEAVDLIQTLHHVIKSCTHGFPS